MKRLFFVLILIAIIAQASVAQVGDSPVVNSNMIQISYDGISFVDATALVSDIEIVVGSVAEAHETHARRGTIIRLEGQLGTPHSDKKMSCLLDTSKIPRSENRVYARFKFAVPRGGNNTGLLESVFSVLSDVIKMVGKPGKIVNLGSP